MKLTGWGRYPVVDCRWLSARYPDEAVHLVQTHDSLIARGNGRAYGDAALNRLGTLSMMGFNRVLDFDAASRRITCEAGMLLSDLLAFTLPRGFFVPVSPGTQYVTLGGMFAADVHGKNHHKQGSFGDFVESARLLLANGGTVACSTTNLGELFAATRGGMGLTGVILDLTFRLLPVESRYVRQETVRARELAQVMDLFEESADVTYTVAWIDCFARGRSAGRSILYRGEHANVTELPPQLRATPLQVHSPRRLRMPFDFPTFLLNKYTIGAFNTLYYLAGRPSIGIVDFESFFYPLDAILEWNRIYGRPGFVQYQCVMPKRTSYQGISRLLDRISSAGKGSFLAVLKLFGHQSGLLSFPMEGYTLALDFPADAATFRLLNELDDIVSDHGGRIYLAKDARMKPGMLAAGYPGLAAFRDVRARHDPGHKFNSCLSERLEL